MVGKAATGRPRWERTLVGHLLYAAPGPALPVPSGTASEAWFVIRQARYKTMQPPTQGHTSFHQCVCFL